MKKIMMLIMMLVVLSSLSYAFKVDYKNGGEIEIDDKISFKLANKNKSNVAKDNEGKYKDILKDVDIKYTKTDKRLKEDIIFKKEPKYDSIVFDFQLNGYPYKIADGKIMICEKEQPDMCFGGFLEPFIVQTGVKVPYTFDGSQLIIDLTQIDWDALSFPVILDPVYDDYNGVVDTSKWRWTGSLSEDTISLNAYAASGGAFSWSSNNLLLGKEYDQEIDFIIASTVSGAFASPNIKLNYGGSSTTINSGNFILQYTNATNIVAVYRNGGLLTTIGLGASAYLNLSASVSVPCCGEWSSTTLFRINVSKRMITKVNGSTFTNVILNTKDSYFYANNINKTIGEAYNWSVTKNGMMLYNGSETTNDEEKFILNLTSGNYTIGDEIIYNVWFINHSPASKTFTVHNSNYSVYVKNALGNIIDNLDINMTGGVITNDNPIVFDKINFTNGTTIYVNITDDSNFYNQLQTSFVVDYEDDSTTITLAAKTFLSTFIDEKTLGPFDMNSPSQMYFLVYCDEATYQYPINTSPVNITIPCSESKFVYRIEYLSDVYSRSIITSPTARNATVYLINLDNTSAIQSNFKIDDILNEYVQPSLFLYKYINTTKTQIHGDFVDFEGGVVATLIEGDTYFVEVCSLNKPCEEKGIYVANTVNTKIIRMYDVGIVPEVTGFIATVTYLAGTNNETGALLAFGLYNDTGRDTSSVKFSLYLNSTNGALIYTDTTTDQQKVWWYDITAFEDKTVVAEIIMVHNGTEYTYAKTIHTSDKITLPIMQYLGEHTMNWFLLILLGLIALAATVRTANIVALLVWALAALFTYFGWFTISWSILGLVAIISIVSFLKQEDKRTDRI